MSDKCPFCGSVSGGCTSRPFQRVCKACGAEGPRAATEEQAMALWKVRAGTKDGASELDSLATKVTAMASAEKHLGNLSRASMLVGLAGGLKSAAMLIRGEL